MGLRQTPLVAAFAIAMLALPLLAQAQTASQDQLRSTILSEITSDPRSQQMTQAQIYALVNALSVKAEQQGLTASALQYRPTTGPSAPPNAGGAFQTCTDFSCSLSQAFGLDGSLPIIPIAFVVASGLFILIFGLMREMGHPHAQLPGSNNTPTAA
jgi:hypothetical protein